MSAFIFACNSNNGIVWKFLEQLLHSSTGFSITMDVICLRMNLLHRLLVPSNDVQASAISHLDHLFIEVDFSIVTSFITSRFNIDSNFATTTRSGNFAATTRSGTSSSRSDIAVVPSLALFSGVAPDGFGTLG